MDAVSTKDLSQGDCVSLCLDCMDFVILPMVKSEGGKAAETKASSPSHYSLASRLVNATGKGEVLLNGQLPASFFYWGGLRLRYNVSGGEANLRLVNAPRIARRGAQEETAPDRRAVIKKTANMNSLLLGKHPDISRRSRINSQGHGRPIQQLVLLPFGR